MHRKELVTEGIIIESSDSKIQLIASKMKVAAHTGKITKYLKDGNIYPVTLELDLTSRCNRNCPNCPSARSIKTDHLSQEFVDRLLSVLSENTRGLLLTGGETTLSPLFPETLRKAKEKGFWEIAVVSNGSRLDIPEVTNPLLEYASVIRISMYDFNKSTCEGPAVVLNRISELRKRIDLDRRDLEIGVSVLTSASNISILEDIVRSVSSSGAHWVYFHPFCSNWDYGAPEIIDQAGVEDQIKYLQKKYSDIIGIYYPEERYSNNKFEFSGYHGSHFLMVVGADGKNYLGAETKYDPEFVIADLNEDLSDNFLWNKERLNLIHSVKSLTFKAIGSRHRGSLYSSLIEKMKEDGSGVNEKSGNNCSFKYPYIL